MAGEIWRQLWYVGKQASARQAVAATRRLYVMSPSITVDSPVEVKSFATGDRMPGRAHRRGRTAVAGGFGMDVSGSECLEPLAMTFGDPTTSTPDGATNARRHLFKVGADPVDATIEYYDGARAWRAIGASMDTFSVDGDAAGGNMAQFGLFALAREPLDPITTGLTERTPTYYAGFETRVFLDAWGGTPGTTEVVDAAIAWNIAFSNNRGRKAFANNSREYQKITSQPIGLTGSVRLEASEAIALTEYLNWDVGTARMLRLELGNNVVIDAGTNEQQTITIDATGGTFTISWGGYTTGALAWNATAAQVLSALLALPPFVYGDLSVGLAGLVYTITFTGRYSGMNVAAFTTGAGSLTGGAQTAVVATTVAGVAGFKELVWIDIPLIWTGADITPEGEGTREYSFPFASLYDPTFANVINVTCQNARTSLWT